MKTYFGVAAVVVLLLSSSALYGQTTSTLAGTVVDQTGAVVADASVTVSSAASGISRSVTTGDTGIYRFDLLPPGIYTIKVTKAGFGITTAANVQLLVSRTTTQNFTLTPGTQTEMIQVSAEAPLLDLEKTSVGLEIRPSDIENLPLNGRDFANLAYLAPGAKATAPWDPTKARVSGVGVNGSNGRNMNITVNGIDNKDNTVGGPVMQLPLEAVQEAVISTQRFSAANGRSSGSSMSVITRSGTNAFHGSVYLFDTQTALNANDKLNAGNPTPQFERQQFGGRFGGPIRKDKDFAFFAWERLREHTAIPVRPDAFTELSLVKNLNLGNVTFNAQPAPTIPTPYTDTRYNGRFDHNFNTSHSFFLSYAAESNQDLNDQSGNATDLTQGNFQKNELIVTNATLTSVLSPTVVNSLTAGFQYWNNLIDSAIRAPLVLFGPVANRISFGTNTNVPQQSYQRKYQFRDDLSFTKGRHGMKVGVDYLWEPSLGGFFESNSTLQYTFDKFPSVILTDKTNYPQGFQTPGAVKAMAISKGNGRQDLPGGAKMFGIYFQDTWKTTSRLTLDLGIRYDRDFNLMASNVQAKSRTYQLLKAINSPYAGIPQDFTKGFSPRVGFAYDVTGGGKNILRGGYGLYIDQTFLNIPLFMIQQANAILYTAVIDISSSEKVPGTNIKLSDYRLGIDPLPTIPPPITQLTPGAVGRLMSPDYRNPYSQEWNIGFAHSFSPSTVGEIEYIHEIGLHEEKRQILNYIDNTNGGKRVLQDQLDAAGQPRIARISMETPWGRSRYDGMNITLRRRMANRFTINSTYTLSRGLAYNGNAASYSNTVTDPRFPLLPSDFGPVPNDERHHFSLSAVVSLPWGFQVAPIMQVASARPYVTSTGINNLLFGSGPSAAHAIVQKSDPGNVLWGASKSASELRNCYLVTKDCIQAPYNSLRGQPYFDLDARLTKTIKFGERSNLKLIFQGFNLTNRANFGNNYDGNVTSKTFGTPIGYIGCNTAGCTSNIPKAFRAEFGGQFTF